MWNSIQKKIMRTLNIKSSEKTLVLWSFFLAFLVGAAQCYLIAVPMGLFLISFSSASLPQLYLVVAGLAIGIGGFYGFFEKRLSFNPLMTGFLVLIGCVTGFLWFLVTGFNTVWLIALLTVWGIVAFDLLNLILWSVFSRIFNLQQGKRLFGIIGAWQSIGGIFSGLLLPLLLIIISPKHVMLIVGVMIFFSLVILSSVLKNHAPQNHDEHDEEEATVDRENNSLRTLFKNKYILKLISMVMLGIFAMYLVDILFNTLAETRYPNPEALAGFLGVFLAFVDGANLLLSTLVFSWFLTRFGIILSLMILPIIAITIGAVLLVSSAVPGFAFLCFSLIVLLKLFEESIRASITGMSNLLLLQPLTPRLRSFTKSKLDTFFVPLAIGIISLILMAVIHGFGIVIPALVAAVVLIYLIYTAIILTLKSDYVRVLTKAIANRYAPDTANQNFSKESLPLFRTALLSQHSDEVIYALSMIEQIDRKEFIKQLASSFESTQPDIQTFILAKIKSYKLMSFFSSILSRIDTEQNRTIKSHMIHALAELNYDDAKHKIQQCMNDDSYEVYCAAIISSWTHDDPAMKYQVLQTLQQMIHSKKDYLRKSAAFIIGELNDRHLNKYLGELINDQSFSVKNEVFRAAIKTKQVEYFDDLLHQMHVLQLSGNILHQFVALGKKAMPVIKKNFTQFPLAIQVKLIYILGEMKLKSAVSYIEHHALNKNGTLQQHALRSLVRIKEPLSQSFMQKLHHHIRDETVNLAEQNALLCVIPLIEQTDLLRSAMKRKTELTLEDLLLSLSIYYPHQPVMKIKISLQSGSPDAVSYALELLDRILDSDHKKLIIPVLNDLFFSDQESNDDLNSAEFIQLLKNNLRLVDTEPVSILACISSLAILKIIGIKSFSDELKALRQSDLPVIKETLVWLKKT